MDDKTIECEQVKAKPRKGWRERIVPLLTLLVVIAISVGLFLYYGRYPERITELKNYSYLGAFLISLLGSATIFIPFVVLPALTAISIGVYPIAGPIGPIIVGLLGGVGAAIGELSAYTLGYSGQSIVGDSNTMYLRLVGWMKKWGILVVFVSALFPFFFDITGIAAGALRMPLWKFILANWAGRTINYVAVSLLIAVWGWEALLRLLG
ncbi:MAG: VTT domain-containing protein [Chloroflexi bacterium]|nr:VTT domain-containing protein [Chloroflexota bacterium]